MKRPKRPRQPNYLRKLRYLWRIGALPRGADVSMVTVYHDDWCGFYQAKRCNCNPNIRLKATIPGTMN
jgi:hypothetical protein